MIINVTGVNLKFDNEKSLFVKDLLKALINFSYNLSDDKESANFQINFENFPQSIVIKNDLNQKIISHFPNQENYIHPGICLDVVESTFETLLEIAKNKKIIVLEDYDETLINFFNQQFIVILNKAKKCVFKNVYFVENSTEEFRKKLFSVSGLFISNSLYINRFCAESLSQGCSIYNNLLLDVIPLEFITTDLTKIKKINQIPLFLSIESTAQYYDSIMKCMYKN